MRVFVTGATGFIGTAIVQELINAGHEVLGLARSVEAERLLVKAGAEPHRGSLEDLESLRRGADASDAVIHAGFIHDFSKFKANCEIDRRAIDAIGSALAISKRKLIVTSGIAVLPPGKIALESDRPLPGPDAIPRIASEEAADAVASKQVPVSVLRLPPTVHGDGDHGFVPLLINIAREKGLSAYVGDGLNRWPAVHRLDAAVLYRLLLEKENAQSHYHGVAEGGISFREIATIIGQQLNLPVVSLTTEQASAHFGWFAHFAAIDIPASSAYTREELGWTVTQHGLIVDLKGKSYFSS